MTSVLLYSGGLDSVCIRRLYPVDRYLYVDIGSRYSAFEIARLPSYVEVFEFKSLGQFEMDNSMVPGRNMFFAAIGSLFADEVVFGFTSGDRPADKDFSFLEKMTSLVSHVFSPAYWNDFSGRHRVVAPFKSVSKTMLVRKYLRAGFPVCDLLESYSCYQSDPPCGVCKACRRRWVALVNNGVDPGYDSSDAVMEIDVPEVLSGDRPRLFEDDDILSAVGLI